jgi:hypothetical protein
MHLLPGIIFQSLKKRPTKIDLQIIVVSRTNENLKARFYQIIKIKEEFIMANKKDAALQRHVKKSNKDKHFVLPPAMFSSLMRCIGFL